MQKMQAAMGGKPLGPNGQPSPAQIEAMRVSCNRYRLLAALMTAESHAARDDEEAPSGWTSRRPEDAPGHDGRYGRTWWSGRPRCRRTGRHGHRKHDARHDGRRRYARHVANAGYVGSLGELRRVRQLADVTEAMKMMGGGGGGMPGEFYCTSARRTRLMCRHEPVDEDDGTRINMLPSSMIGSRRSTRWAVSWFKLVESGSRRETPLWTGDFGVTHIYTHHIRGLDLINLIYAYVVQVVLAIACYSTIRAWRSRDSVHRQESRCSRRC